MYVFTKKETPLKKIFPKNTKFQKTALTSHSPKSGDITYVDISGLTATDVKKIVIVLKQRCKQTPWGIIDPSGSINDPAGLFFEGASDYLGPVFFKESKNLDLKRLKAALMWRTNERAGGIEKGNASSKNKTRSAGILKSGIKLPSSSLFPGWKKMQTGRTIPFYLLYCSLQGKTAINARLGEKAYAFLHQQLLAFLYKNFQGSEGLIWMDSGKDCLFLLPPKLKNAGMAVEACIRMLISAPLIAVETLSLTVPANFVFALHYGSVTYSPPGKTGTVISDAVNFVFHLGAKKAEPGRLTISGELPDGTVHPALEDCFVSSGEFEGREIWHTRKFSYVKPWL